MGKLLSKLWNHTIIKKFVFFLQQHFFHRKSVFLENRRFSIKFATFSNIPRAVRNVIRVGIDIRARCRLKPGKQGTEICGAFLGNGFRNAVNHFGERHTASHFAVDLVNQFLLRHKNSFAKYGNVLFGVWFICLFWCKCESPLVSCAWHLQGSKTRRQKTCAWHSRYIRP